MSLSFPVPHPGFWARVSAAAYWLFHCDAPADVAADRDKCHVLATEALGYDPMLVAHLEQFGALGVNILALQLQSAPADLELGCAAPSRGGSVSH